MNNDNLVLGKSTSYDNEYAPSRLQRIERSLGRSQIKDLTTFFGYDIWHLYEMTYLNLQGLPCVAMAVLKIPADSKYIVESKSLKLYELSFTMTRFASLDEVKTVFLGDLSRLLECEVLGDFYPLKNTEFKLSDLSGICLEELDECKALTFKSYNYAPALLKIEDDKKQVSKTYHTNLFRSLCPVTAQPDHASIEIEYEGKKPSVTGLLGYLVSLRNHQGFHEQCVELIYSDLLTYLTPEMLTIRAYFTRRGGIDINPVRSNSKNVALTNKRTIRQ